MTDLEKYQLVNSCETIEALTEAVLKCAEGDEIEGRTRGFDAKKMSENVEHVVAGTMIPNALTRKWGIRQQAMYLNFYIR